MSTVADVHDQLRQTDLAPLVESYGEVTLEPADDLFERLVVSIVNQLISTEAARTIRKRLFAAVDITPEGILAAKESTLREAGLSPQKTEYVRAVATWFVEEQVTADQFKGQSDTAVIDTLTEINGIGVWTAKMTLMFGLGRPDVFPVEDLAVRRGMTALFDDDSRPEMRARAEAWAPYRSTAALYIWEYYVDENSTVDSIVS
jgi:DNA-3-methyladenine glycosylase II